MRYTQHLIPALSTLPHLETPLTPSLRRAIEDIVTERIRAHAIASRGQHDFALRAAGGRIVPALTTGCTSMFHWSCNGPSVAIDEDVRVGQCWDIRALPAQLGVVLPKIIQPSHVTVEHLPKEINSDIGTAPRNMTLWGIVDGKANIALFEDLLRDDPGLEALGRRRPHIATDHRYAPLLSFTYDVDGEDAIQTFGISERFRTTQMSFAVFVLEVEDSWGGASTCLYRVRIHGTVV
ncbi:uncharacterized protein C8Q71DRAFT_714738 [Rhodofomes roseus]|uniref:SUN domain-containing protein n=1 Tax=Rhodofomes roseus TaxID=34475 RepID=A0ABQ8K4N8_9APHY|nr:uncharacterized protein C8Q71DRAFT_714738 [Rhodofomes roseus]KAH9831926.1 hypothetical protein C8Q71DRAFT_714738 [Rhodofomes roseus]